jgi:thiol-disulfide isomerase/thioredoxin
VALILLISSAARAQITEKELAGKLVEVNGKFTQPLRAPATVVPKYIALYYGADWCGPCHKFTPDLVAFYNDLRPKHSDFQVIFMSRDTSAAEMTNYMVEMKMPWPALRYDAVKWSPLNKYCGPGIPCLVVINDKGEVLSDSFNGKTYLGPHKPLEDLRALLAHAGAAVSGSTPFAAASASPTRTGTPISPSGTNWDQVFKKRPP